MHRTLVFGDMVPEPMAEPPSFPPEFTVQKHDTTDVLYSLRHKKSTSRPSAVKLAFALASDVVILITRQPRGPLNDVQLCARVWQ